MHVGTYDCVHARTHARTCVCVCVCVCVSFSSELRAALEKAGCVIEKVGNELQVEGAASFVASWTELMASIQSKSAAMAH